MIPDPEQQPPLARILFIEDARDLALVVVRELEAAGYQVTHNARTVKQACDKPKRMTSNS